ncbi:MAG: hypothetical protein U1A27_00585 [Phycisphaerae bacterium]
MIRYLAFVAALLLAATAARGQCLGLQTSGAQITVHSSLTGYRLRPAVAYSATSDRYAVAWTEAPAGTDNDVYYRFINSDGSLMGDTTPVVQKLQSQSNAEIAWNGTDNNFLITWESQESGQDGFGRTLTPAGALGANDFQIIDAANEVRVAYGSSGNRWMVTARTGGCSAQRVNSNGTLEGLVIPVHQSGSVAPNGDVEYDSVNGRFLAVWRDQSAQNIQARIIKPDGTFQTNQFKVNDVYPFYIRAAFSPAASQFLVVSDRSGQSGLRGQFVTAAGAPTGSLITITDAAFTDPKVVYNAATDVYVVIALRNNQLASFVVRPDGTVTADRVTVAYNVGDGHDIAYNSDDGSCLVVWTDQLGDQSRILAQELDFGGSALLCPIAVCGVPLCGFGYLAMMPWTLLGLWGLRRAARRRMARLR